MTGPIPIRSAVVTAVIAAIVTAVIAAVVTIITTVTIIAIAAIITCRGCLSKSFEVDTIQDFIVGQPVSSKADRMSKQLIVSE